MARMPSPVVEVPDFWVWHEMAMERGWTDGLVVAPPTRERVDQMIAYLGRRPDEVVGVLGPKDGIATDPHGSDSREPAGPVEPG